MDRVKSVLQILANFLYRRPTKGKGNHLYLQVTKLISLAFFAAIGLLLFSVLSREYALWEKGRPVIPLDKKSWKIALDKSGLKTSQKFLDDRSEGSALIEGEVSSFWMEMGISPEIRDRVIELQAPYFQLGWVYGDVQVFANGHLIKEVPVEDLDPITFQIPQLELEVLRNIRLKITPDKNVRHPTPLTRGFGEGFNTVKGEKSFRSFHDFLDKHKSFALFMVYFVFSIIFLVLWDTHKSHLEYLMLALFSLVSSIPEITYSNGFDFRVDHEYRAFFLLLIFAAKAALGLGIGLAFARSRGKVIFWSVLAIFSALSLKAYLSDMPTQFKLIAVYLKTWIPITFSLGALACLIQLAALLQKSKSRTLLKARIFRLGYFSTFLFLLGISFHIQFGMDMPFIMKKFVWGTPELVFVLALGVLVVLDYKNQSNFLEKTPLSRYHKTTPLPEAISGVLLMMDLKNSETFFKLGTQLREFETIVPTIISYLWKSIEEAGGVILSAEGDEIVAFFDEENHIEPAKQALIASEYCRKSLDLLREQYDFDLELNFRGGIAQGSIRPIWIGSGSDRLPAWSSVGQSIPLVEAARLMDIEKRVEQNLGSCQSLVLMSSQVSVEIDSLRGEFVERKSRYRGKHDTIYLVDVFRPGQQQISSSLLRNIS